MMIAPLVRLTSFTFHSTTNRDDFDLRGRIAPLVESAKADTGSVQYHSAAGRAMVFYPYVSRRRFDQTEGVNEVHTIRVQAIGKDNRENPYLISNEWIAATLGRFIGLPIPPCALMRKKDRRTQMFASISFEGTTKPRGSLPGPLWDKHKELCTGIIAFDILIANCDRHCGNIKVDRQLDPKQVFVFDHDRALFYNEPNRGTRRLRQLFDRLGISGGSVTQNNRHCLIDVISTGDHLETWIDKINKIPDFFIRQTCREVHRVGGVKKRDVEAVIQFITHRKRDIRRIVREHKSEFPNISHWPLLFQ